MPCLRIAFATRVLFLQKNQGFMRLRRCIARTIFLSAGALTAPRAGNLFFPCPVFAQADGFSRNSFRRSTTDRGAVAARIACAFESCSWRVHDRAGVAHHLIERGDALHRMPGGRKLSEKLCRKSALQTQRRTRFSPGSAEHPTRGGNGLLEVLTVQGIPREQSRL